MSDVYQKFLIYFQLSRHVRNEKSSKVYKYFISNSFNSSKVENIHRKNQKNLSKLSEDKRQI
ncbi:hypothetical protein C2G38_2092816, partial [Gigaspora rosea]